MPYVYISGKAATVGSPGDHDYEFVSGESLTDAATDGYVIVSGTPVGSGWTTYEINTPDTITRQAGGSPLVELEHGGGSRGFIIARRSSPISSPPVEVEFSNSTYTANNPDFQNNFVLGFSATPDSRPFDSNVASIGVYFQESGSTNPTRQFKVHDSNGNVTQTTLSSSVSWTDTLTVGFDGTDGYLLVNGSEVARHAADNVDYYPAVSLEDDGDVSEGDRATVGSVTVVL